MVDFIFSLLLRLHFTRKAETVSSMGCIPVKTTTLFFITEGRDSGCITPLVKLPQSEPSVISVFINRLKETSNQMMLQRYTIETA